MGKDEPVRFGAEFGPKRAKKSTGVSLSTFKSLVWISNIGGLTLFAIGLEMMIVSRAKILYWPRGNCYFGYYCTVPIKL